MNSKLLNRALPQPDWAIGSIDGATVFEVRRLALSPAKFIVVEANRDGSVTRIDSIRGMTLQRAKERATWLARES